MSKRITRRVRDRVELSDGTAIYRCERSVWGECSKGPPNHWVCWTPTTTYSPAYPTLREAFRAAGYRPQKAPK